MELNELTAISPIDGRYRKNTEKLSNYFSEFALIKTRIYVEILYFLSLSDILSKNKPEFNHIKKVKKTLLKIYEKFSQEEALKIKQIESKINHDVKAIEYYLREKFDEIKLSEYKEYIHFGLTSQDINNTAIPLLIRDFILTEYKNYLNNILNALKKLSKDTEDIVMLAHTHGQPASPTRMGKEIAVFIERIQNQMKILDNIQYYAKFGGATGNLNAHYVAFPDIDWHKFADDFIEQNLGLKRYKKTTQIEHYDNLAALFDNIRRINVILIDLCRDIWLYISMEYFKQKVKKGEVGSSTMPHKINPIDFENAEGNLMYANAIFDFLSNKLPVSRLQRDLTDSTVIRNIGVPFAHSILAYDKIINGISRLQVNTNKINQDLVDNWVVIAEAVQTILRRENYTDAYEKLKEFTRKADKISKKEFFNFIEKLNISENLKKELKNITPFNYTGK